MYVCMYISFETLTHTCDAAHMCVIRHVCDHVQMSITYTCIYVYAHCTLMMFIKYIRIYVHRYMNISLKRFLMRVMQRMCVCDVAT